MAKYRQVIATTDDSVVLEERGALLGFSLAEATSVAPAKVYLRDGTDETGRILAVITLAPNESVRDSLYEGVNFGSSLFVDVVEGEIEGCVWFSG